MHGIIHAFSMVMNNVTETLLDLLNANEEPIFNRMKLAYRLEDDLLGVLFYCPVLKVNQFSYIRDGERYTDPWVKAKDIGSYIFVMGDLTGIETDYLNG